ncbi:hypothetical protein KKC52_12585, partial [bacterium]|nr:hypothetical protein [bacterium]
MGYTGDLQNNGGGSWSKKYILTVTAPAQALSNGYSVRQVFSGADASAIYNGAGGLNALRMEHSIPSPASTTLNGSINATQITITVTSTIGYPQTGMIIIGTERIAYVGIIGNVFQNCVRGASGTTAAAYLTGVVAYVKEMERHIETFTYSSVVVWFKIRANIAALATDTNYTLYFSNGSAGA